MYLILNAYPTSIASLYLIFHGMDNRLQVYKHAVSDDQIISYLESSNPP